MTAVGEFLASPLGFMEKNVVVVGFDGIEHDPLRARIEEMTFVTKSIAQGEARQLGKSLGLYFAVPKDMVASLPGVTADGRTFSAYFCPYRQNDVLGTTVANEADFMFTATMDGCSLGIGTAGRDGSRLIYHANSGGDASKQDLNLQLTMGASLSSVFGPGSYRSEYGQGVLKSTTFGVRSRSTKQWGFYSQVYFEDKQAIPRKYFLRQVKDVG